MKTNLSINVNPISMLLLLAFALIFECTRAVKIEQISREGPFSFHLENHVHSGEFSFPMNKIVEYV